MLEKYLKQIESKVDEIFSEDHSGHDISHLKRVMNIAINLQNQIKGESDKIIVGLAAYLHDVHRIMHNKVGRFVSPKESLPTIREILSVTELSSKVINEICFCIEHHENYNWNGNNVTNINALIVQDADNLDALGAIGIGRTFTYGGAFNIKMYDENVPLDPEYQFSENKGFDPSTIHHFYRKLFKLADNMNTAPAKELAKKRTQFIKDFVDEFFAEWNGEK